MKVMITSFTYYPEVNGIQYVTQFLAESLTATGHEVTIITTDLPNTSLAEHNGVVIKRVKMLNQNLLSMGDKKGFQKLVVGLAMQMDIAIFTQLGRYSADWALPILNQIQCKTLLYMHGMHRFKWGEEHLVSLKEIVKKCIRDIYWQTFYIKAIHHLKQFNGLICLHEKEDMYLYFKKKNMSNSYVLYNFAEKMFFQKDCKFIDGIRVFLYISNYHKRKNQLMLLKAFYALEDKNIKLVCIGAERNAYYEKIAKEEVKLSRKYGKKEVDLLYQIPRIKLPEYLKQAYTFVMPSLWEGFPIVLAEAMASGVPFISTSVGINKYLPGGMCVAPNVKSLREGMQFLLEHPYQRNEMAKAAFSYASDCLSPDAYMKHFMEIVSQL